MAIIKCKMCGGELNLTEGQSVAECEYCGSRQTVPNQDNEKKLQQFERADWLRRNCEFDKAAAVYEGILAEFRQESEAYWGLVLCKYGIEYVDDPATGRKIPTCHRSSYDSVLDDANLEQALDYADAVARKVYREEAKTIEKIREGILEVSSNEKPYDIFICYKETAPDGDRTLDSVLAQDLYTALTDKGYRVFFSRITLRHKLGEAYEPYIFAALNSAKVMLAIGTDPEYYNAVWVKNEWSRYLKICAADKSKHLIPCYKDLDAYDMPREFRPLQGVDLGKMGAIQDILFNMEKYIPLKNNTTVIQEKVVVGGSGDNKIASLLDRGNMALEDGDWAKADSFFEDVLNNDSKNAQAYLGKTLAQEKCRTIDAFARKRKDASQNVKGQTLHLEPNYAHVDEMAAQFSLSGYVDRNSIRKLYDFDLSYHSDAAERKQQYRNEENYWANHKQLSRAEKFAVGAVAENLAAEKKALLAALADRVKKAEAAENAAKTDVQQRYEAHLKQADKKAEKLYNDGLSRREKYYQELLKTAKTSSDVAKLTETANKFDALGDYQDSKNLAEHCRKRADEEQAKIDAEAERQRLIKEKQEKERKAKNKRNGILAAIAAVIVIAVIIVMTTVVIPGNNYKKAQAMLDNGQYMEAVTAFEALEDYKDSAKKVLEAHYAYGEYLLTQGEKTASAMAFGKAGNHGDARTRSMELWAEIAQRDVISASSYSSVAVRSDGTVLTAGWIETEVNKLVPQSSEEVINASLAWTDVVEVAAGSWYTIGLKSDGTVVAAGDNRLGQCDVDGWTDIVSIATGGGFTLGLKTDGTVVATGDNQDRQCEVSEWTDIIAVDAGFDFSIGLKADGTVVVAGDNPIQSYNREKWTDIVAISAGNSHAVGLRSDGTVIAGGANEYYVDDWTNIIAIAAGNDYTLGLRADGTVVTTEKNDLWGDWQNIVALAADYDHSVGLKSDGTAVAVGKNEYGETDVSGWTDIRLPALSADQREAMENEESRKEGQYADALALVDSGNIIEAYEILIELGDYKDSAAKAEEIYPEYMNLRLLKADVGDYVIFGSYEQDNNTANGTEKIEWRVLDKQDNRILVVSRYALDSQPYNTLWGPVTWESCSLRKWLNHDFMDAAFSADERAMIPIVTVSADKNPEYDTDPGNPTQDQVFALSITEAQKYFDSNGAMWCVPTDHTLSYDIWTSDFGTCWWWLRSPGNSNYGAAGIGDEGIAMGGANIIADAAVRPAMWIELPLD